MSGIYDVYKYLPNRIAKSLKNSDINVHKAITEIRIRKNRELIIVVNSHSCFINAEGKILNKPENGCIKVNSEEFEQLFMNMCSYSVYSKTHELNSGYITLDCGARAGVASEAVFNGNEIKSVKNINSINIRIPRAVRGCADKLLKSIYYDEALPSIVVAGLPNCGKTTLLRDLGIQLSSGYNERYRKIVFIDERFEFFGNGNASELAPGINCDIISGFSKAEGIENATRTLSPEMIICDEITTKNEINSIMFAFSTGISIAFSLHASGIEDLKRNEIIKLLVSYGKVSAFVIFEGYSFNYKICKIDEVFNANCSSLAVDYFNNGNGSYILNES